MNDTDKQMVIARFLQAGVFDLQGRLGTCMREHTGDIFAATFFSPAGRTVFELDLVQQVDAVTLNLERYTVKHQPAIVIPDLVAGTVNTRELEARIKSLDYIRELDGAQVLAVRGGIQRDLDFLRDETKPASQAAYLAFLVKYHQQFHFWDAPVVQELRRQKLEASYREKVYPLVGRTRVLPAEAFEEITSAGFRMPKRVNSAGT